MRTYYIQRKAAGERVETVDEFPNATRAYATRMLAEYRMSDPHAHYYLSPRACKAWRES